MFAKYLICPVKSSQGGKLLFTKTKPLRWSKLLNRIMQNPNRTLLGEDRLFLRARNSRPIAKQSFSLRMWPMGKGRATEKVLYFLARIEKTHYERNVWPFDPLAKVLGRHSDESQNPVFKINGSFYAFYCFGSWFFPER